MKKNFFLQYTFAARAHGFDVFHRLDFRQQRFFNLPQSKTKLSDTLATSSDE